MKTGELKALRAKINKKAEQKEIAESDAALINGVIDGLEAGAHKRCASCYKWIKAEEVSTVAVYWLSMPKVGYVLCEKCTKEHGGTEAERSNVYRRIDLGLKGETN